jgi:hypothetical protein
MIRDHHPVAAAASTAFAIFGASGGRVLGVLGCVATLGVVFVKDWLHNWRVRR